MKNSRTTNSLYNFMSGISGEVLSMLMQFICRTVFIKVLGESYLGISSLFANLLSMLSLAEFGVGNAILYKLYDPVEKEDHKRVAMILRFSKRTYQIIGMVVAALGVIMMPFLPVFVKEYDKLAELHVNAVLIFSLYLLQSVSSYFFLAYKTAVLQANQKVYIINMTVTIGSVISRIIQIILLVVLKKAGVPYHIIFFIYVFIQLLTVIIQNCVNASIADKMYPYIKEDPREKLPKEEIKGVVKDCSALFIYKLNHVVLKSTDNIIISTFLGLTAVAFYSNYYVLYTTIYSVFLKVYESVVNSLGSLHTKGDLKSEYRTFKAVILITSLLGGTAGVGIYVVADEFIAAWIGKSWVISGQFALLMGVEIYALAIRIALDKYRTAMGLFRQVKYRPLVGMTVNLVVSVALVLIGGESWGITGVIIGTVVSDYTTMLWFDPIIIHRHGFKNSFSVFGYFGKRIFYTVVIAVAAAICKLICTFFLADMGWLSVAVHAVICAVTVPTFLFVSTLGTEESSYLISLVKNEFSKIVLKLKKR